MRIEDGMTTGEGDEIGVILTTKDIPDRSRVTKRTGTQVYILNKTVKIYGEHRQEISQKGISFLVKYDDPHSITAIPNDTLLIWITDNNEYYEHLKKNKEQNGQIT